MTERDVSASDRLDSEEYQGFWSYVHLDDKAEDGRIVRLATDVAEQFKMITGEPIKLFLDKEDIDWGEDWRNRVDEGLESVAFFIAILTPRYFQSPQCRRELQFFARKADGLGVRDLVLPILYVDVPELHEQEPEDELVKMIAGFQWQDWRELRFEDPSSGVYRRGVARLADSLAHANRKAETLGGGLVQDLPLQSQGDDLDEVDGSPGLLDRLATAEETFPAWTETSTLLAAEMEKISQAVHQATRSMQKGDAEGRGFAWRAKVARGLAVSLQQPAETVRSLGVDFAENLYQVDGGVRAILELAPGEIERHPESRIAMCQFYEAIRQLARASETASTNVDELIEQFSPIERMSRDLRPPLRKLRQGLTGFLEGRKVTGEWLGLVDGSGVDCSSVETDSASITDDGPPAPDQTP